MEERQLVDEYMASLQGMKEADPGPYFYAKLRNRLADNESVETSKPAWIIAFLVFLLLVNGIILFKQPAPAYSAKDFAAAYDQQLKSDY